MVAPGVGARLLLAGPRGFRKPGHHAARSAPASAVEWGAARGRLAEQLVDRSAPVKGIDTMKKSLSFALVALTLVACTDPAKVPAEAAVQAADGAVASLGDAARKYMPAETEALQQSVVAAKELLAKKEYKAALAAAGEIPGKATALLAAANDKHNDLMASWGEASGPLPQILGAIKGRLESLAQSKKLPDGVQQSAVDAAQAALTAIETGLAEAKAQADGGDLQAAAVKASDLKAKALQVMASLGMM